MSNIGKKVKGIEFDGHKYPCGWSYEMKKYVGLEGEIIDENIDDYSVEFNDGYGGIISWSYPKELIDKQLNGGLIESIMEKDVEVAKDMVNNPSHYNKGGIECIDVIKASLSPEAYKGFLKGNCQKYLYRYEDKFNPIEDVNKLIWYANKLKQELENDEK